MPAAKRKRENRENKKILKKKRDGFPVINVSERRMIIPMEGLKKWLATNGGQI